MAMRSFRRMFAPASAALYSAGTFVARDDEQKAGGVPRSSFLPLSPLLMGSRAISTQCAEGTPAKRGSFKVDRQQLSIDSSSRRCTSHVVTVTKQMQALDFSHQGMASLGGLLTLGDLIILRATSHPTCSFACQVQIELSAAHIHSVIGLNFLPGDMDASPEGDYNFIKTFVQRDNIDIRQAVRHCGYTWDPKESAFRRRFGERHIEDYHKDFPPKDYQNYRYHSETFGLRSNMKGVVHPSMIPFLQDRCTHKFEDQTDSIFKFNGVHCALCGKEHVDNNRTQAKHLWNTCRKKKVQCGSCIALFNFGASKYVKTMIKLNFEAVSFEHSFMPKNISLKYALGRTEIGLPDDINIARIRNAGEYRYHELDGRNDPLTHAIWRWNCSIDHDYDKVEEEYFIKNLEGGYTGEGVRNLLDPDFDGEEERAHLERKN